MKINIYKIIGAIMFVGFLILATYIDRLFPGLKWWGYILSVLGCTFLSCVVGLFLLVEG